MKRVETIAMRLKILMIERALCQTDISAKTGIDRPSLSMYITGKRIPGTENICLIAEAYGVNPAWIMGYDVPMSISEIAPSMVPEPIRKACYDSRAKEILNAYENAEEEDKDRLLLMATKIKIKCAGA